jgi:hypothetical protein
MQLGLVTGETTYQLRFCKLAEVEKALELAQSKSTKKVQLVM